MLNASRVVTFDLLEAAINGLFLRLHAGALTADDMIEASSVNSFAAAKNADNWYKAGAVMEQDIVPFRYLDDPETTILDVGAHTGYTAASLRHTPLRNFIHSIEPMSLYNPTLDRIRQIDPRYSYSNLAGSDSQGSADAYNLVINGALIGGTTSIGGGTFRDWFAKYVMTRVGESWLPKQETYDVRLLHVRFDTFRLEDLIMPYRMQWERSGTRISGLKIDVEGHEQEAIAGAERLLLDHTPLVMIEVTNLKGMNDTMATFGYAPYERADDKIRPLRGSHYNVYYVHEAMLGHYRSIGLIAA